MKSIHIDRSKRLFADPGTGHNRWHPDIPPILEAAPGEEILLETRDAADGQVKLGMSVADLEQIDAKVAHPLTGPIWIQGAKPGDQATVDPPERVPGPIWL